MGVSVRFGSEVPFGSFFVFFDLTELYKAAVLGIIEGLTEFIPVSSTAHLLISSYLIDFESIKNHLFEVVIQLGAILAILVIYRQKFWGLIVGLKQKNQQKFLLNLIVAFLPAALLGGALHSFIKRFLFSNLIIAIALILGGIIMVAIDRNSKTESNKVCDQDYIQAKTAFYIGLFQCLAMIPGVSRSGATIIGGLLLGLNRKTATEFSFFLAIPTIAAASLYDLLTNSSELTGADLGVLLIGTLSAFFSALLVIKWFIDFVSKNSFLYFGIYRIIAGSLILFFIP